MFSLESLDEMFRVLVPGGRILCIWNLPDIREDWVKQTEDMLKEYFLSSDTPIARNGEWKEVLEDYNGLRLLNHSISSKAEDFKGPKEFMLGYYESMSVITMLDTAAKRRACDKFKAVLNKYFDEVRK